MLRTRTTNWIFGTTLCFLLPLPFPAFATTIVAILEETSVTIAADGIMSTKSIETGNPIRIPICKMRCFDRLCFAASGASVRKSIGFNVYELAEKELERPRTLKEASEHFKTVFTPLIPKVIAGAKKDSTDWYAKWLKGLPMLEYLFAGFDANGTSAIVTGSVRIDGEGRALPIEEDVLRGKAWPPIMLAIGANEQIANHMDRHPGWIIAAASNPIEFAEKMIRIEIQASEKDGRRNVGEPISIARLTDKSPHTLERMGNCQSRQVRTQS